MALPQRDSATLVVASGARLYAFRDGFARPHPFATLPGIISSAVLEDDRVRVAGRFRGIRDALEDRVVTGAFGEWDALAVQAGRLYGASGCEVHDLSRNALVARRNGRIRWLSGGRFLADHGNYRQRWHKRTLHDPVPKFTRSGKNLRERRRGMHEYDRENVCASAMAQEGIRIALATPRCTIQQGTFVEGHLENLQPVHEMRLRNEHIGNQFYEVWQRFLFGDPDREGGRRQWEDFCALFKKYKGAFPEGFSRVREQRSAKEGGFYPDVPIETMPFEQACRRYRHAFPNLENCPKRDPLTGFYLEPIYSHAMTYIGDRDARLQRINAIALANGEIYCGSQDGVLQAVGPQGARTLAEFSSPVRAILAVPEETYHDGIEQAMRRRLASRAWHAKPRRRLSLAA